MIAKALSQKRELIAFVDRQYITGFLLGEQDLAGLGMMDAASAVKIGKLARVHAMVVGQVFVDSSTEGPKSTLKTHSYTSTIFHINSEGKRESEEIKVEYKYKLWHHSNQAKVRVSYQIISALDGSVIDAEVISKEESSKAGWITLVDVPSEREKEELRTLEMIERENVTGFSKPPFSHQELIEGLILRIATQLAPKLIEQGALLGVSE